MNELLWCSTQGKLKVTLSWDISHPISVRISSTWWPCLTKNWTEMLKCILIRWNRSKTEEGRWLLVPIIFSFPFKSYCILTLWKMRAITTHTNMDFFFNLPSTKSPGNFSVHHFKPTILVELAMSCAGWPAVYGWLNERQYQWFPLLGRRHLIPGMTVSIHKQCMLAEQKLWLTKGTTGHPSSKADVGKWFGDAIFSTWRQHQF